ncbi:MULTISPECIES: alpha/beta hydrolase [Rhodococcus]|uniref:Alpha/beta hydrolase n=2 Tax=Rhodococcus oxybenzonivorans TaxID=1990687 RepID=A0AAE5AAP9_9NOCA|nr:MULTISPECIES: alpha/beta hydrolase [Rhodococcus]MDV7241452.1 alpha/beta hydrolase [Rhodococcus oxybenzonivorans]MDV7269049.1 alpha/beta hydrolase [Rhodococcus oxybenzonivorans]MDV7274015.1 alpha/beta hydrolase [Rhodococcus oxybenzonivorans]MDV7343152.1 alpha/beta hydrolase [Rhodococcus oxybenzonivorans]MDV8028068.1 alpha/beta hydrolase [Rhodococcus sp. IEGM 27]
MMTGRTTEFMHTRDAVIEVVVEGNGPSVILLPSLGRESYDYDDVAEGLAQNGHRVSRPQPRGIGRSEGPLDNITLHDLAADVAAVIEAQDNGAAVVVGHAFGHYVARMLAADRPELVRGVVVAAGGARHYPAELTTLAVRCADSSLPESERLRHLQTGFFAPGNDPAEWLTGWYPDVSKRQLAASAATPKDEWWAVAYQPILDLQAALDPFRPRETANELRDQLGEVVTVSVIPNASHALLPEAPAQVVRALTDWIRTLDS